MRDFHLPGRSTVFATNAMCATSNPLVAKVATDILQAGGNAVDAAVGASVLLGLCETAMTGLGGDCFILFKPAGSQDVVTLNGSGRAPAALDPEKMRRKYGATIAPRSVDAVTVPGAVDAFCAFSERFGQLPLEASLAPAIRYFEEGVPVAPRAAYDWQLHADALSGPARDHFLLNGKPPTTGQVFRAPGQAKVLRKIAKHGRAGFYEGDVAKDIVSSLRAAGGCHTLEDFAKTQSTWGDPISGTYKGVDLLEHPPNGHGATAILIANILSNFDVSTLDPFGVERAHLEAESAKLAFDARNRFVADMDYVTRLEHMLAPETGRQLAELIDIRHAMADPAPLAEQVHKETSYLTIVDKDRNVVSLIYSIFNDFGSGIASEKYGVLLQNRGSGFNLIPGHPNEAGGGKRPMHTIIPAMFRQNGKITASFGVMGGSYQPIGHVRLLSDMMDFGHDMQTAIDGPRGFATEGALRLERGYSEKVRADLAEMGHKIVIPKTPIGGAQCIQIDWNSGVLTGASDPRKDGIALGY